MYTKSELAISGTHARIARWPRPFRCLSPSVAYLGVPRAFYPMGVRVCAYGRVPRGSRSGGPAKLLESGCPATIEYSCSSEAVATSTGFLDGSFVYAAKGRIAETELDFSPGGLGAARNRRHV